MSAATALQALVRFLSQDAKIPLATTLKNIPALQKIQLDSVDRIAGDATIERLTEIFPEDKQAKQILSAAKRVTKKKNNNNVDNNSSGNNNSKKRGGEAISGTAAQKKKLKTSTSPPNGENEEIDLETSLQLPHISSFYNDDNNDNISEENEEQLLANTVIFTNRAPLVLAFIVVLLKHTMPEQPLSSRLSLAQGYVGVTSRARAISLGIEHGTTAEEEGFGEGQPVVRILGKELRVLRRWGYEWREGGKTAEYHPPSTTLIEAQEEEAAVEEGEGEEGEEDQPPAVWALDLEALKKSNHTNAPIVQSQGKNQQQHHLPIYTPQAARAYLLKSFASPPITSTHPIPSSDPITTTTTKKKSTTTGKSQKDQDKASKSYNLALLLRAIELLYESWAGILSPEDLDRRTWGWYVRVRPEVLPGKAGWGGKGEVRLSQILALRRKKEEE